MKPQVRIAVIIPAGPADDADNIVDTVASVVHYTDSPRIILVVDDSSPLRADFRRLHELSPEIAVIPAPPEPGRGGHLWVKVSAGYRWVLDRYEPGIVMRMDVDALLIGRGIETAAEQEFAKNPKIGLLGSYRIGPDGHSRDFSPVAHQLRAETGIRGLRHPQCWSSLRHHRRLAKAQGYINGEHVLASASIHSYSAVNGMYEDGLFEQPWLAPSGLGDDHIMALLTVAAGYRIGDFGGPEHPMALRWRGLPAHPADLLASGKLVTHSVRSWRDLGEQRIRSIFAEAREREHRW